ncbi:hypothetical protein KC19_8G200900 [Ceratodon purpureus]|uniref:Uncharacterized protein n=1 Tax=Ceratodon purpureus TaxID=3225 RepID=A0A8T0H921_CERPU|nr:hypothetical protein KC19_8G200900 [Ceratodon purpureus]
MQFELRFYENFNESRPCCFVRLVWGWGWGVTWKLEVGSGSKGVERIVNCNAHRQCSWGRGSAEVEVVQYCTEAGVRGSGPRGKRVLSQSTPCTKSDAPARLYIERLPTPTRHSALSELTLESAPGDSVCGQCQCQCQCQCQWGVCVPPVSPTSGALRPTRRTGQAHSHAQ